MSDWVLALASDRTSVSDLVAGSASVSVIGV